MNSRPLHLTWAVVAALTLTLAGCSAADSGSANASNEASVNANAADGVDEAEDSELADGTEVDGDTLSGGNLADDLAIETEPRAPADPKRTPGASGKGTASPQFFAYSFTPGLIRAADYPNVFTHDVLTPVDATVGIPAGDSPRPVVYILHGTHYECLDLKFAPMLDASATSYDWGDLCAGGEAGILSESGFKLGPSWISYHSGLSYFANALTAAGYVTVSIDTGTVGSSFLGESGTDTDAYQAILKVHQGILADLKQGKNHGLTVPENTAKVLGSERYAIVGHSTGGGFALHQAVNRKDSNLFAAVGLQPAFSDDKEKSPSGTAARPAPSLALFGTCDEDVRWATAQEQVPEYTQGKSTWPLAVLAIKGGTHAGLNAALDQKDVLKTAKGFDGCTGKPGEGGVLSPAQIQAGYLGATLAFLQQADQGAKTFTLPTAETVQYVDHFKQNLDVKLAPGDLPKVDLGTPTVQQVDEAIIPAWDPKVKPLAPQGG